MIGWVVGILVVLGIIGAILHRVETRVVREKRERDNAERRRSRKPCPDCAGNGRTYREGTTICTGDCRRCEGTGWVKA